MIRRAPLLGLLVLISSVGRAQEAVRQVFISNDPKLVADSIPRTDPSGFGYCDHVRIRHGNIQLAALPLAVRPTSGRWIVEHAGWSEDAQYFVVALAAARTPDTDHRPTWCYDRTSNRFISLDDRVGDVIDSHFILTPPHQLTLRVRTAHGEVLEKTLDLSELTPKAS